MTGELLSTWDGQRHKVFQPSNLLLCNTVFSVVSKTSRSRSRGLGFALYPALELWIIGWHFNIDAGWSCNSHSAQLDLHIATTLALLPALYIQRTTLEIGVPPPSSHQQTSKHDLLCPLFCQHVLKNPHSGSCCYSTCTTSTSRSWSASNYPYRPSYHQVHYVWRYWMSTRHSWIFHLCR